MNTTSFKLTALAISCLAGIELRAQPSTGMYPSTVWASTNLLVNPELEAGINGQVLGYNANLQIVPFTQSGADTNAVASVPDLATLTNTVVGYHKAIVGTDTPQQLFQKIPVDTYPVSGWTSDPTYLQSIVDNGDGTGTITRTGTQAPTSLGPWFSETAIIGTRYRIRFEARANFETFFKSSSTWLDFVDHSATLNVTTTNRLYDWELTANLATALRALVECTTTGNSLTITAPLSGTNVTDETYVSTIEPGYAWKLVGDIYEDAPADGQTYGRKDNTWAVVTGGGGEKVTNLIPDSLTYTGVIPADSGTVVINVSALGQTGSCQFLGTPTIAPGDFIGQKITLLAHNLNRISVVLYDAVSAGHTESGINVFGVTEISLEAGQDGRNTADFIWDGLIWIQTVGSDQSTVVVTALPAPWLPPDTNGVQVLSESVKAAFLRDLLPLFKANWDSVAP